MKLHSTWAPAVSLAVAKASEHGALIQSKHDSNLPYTTTGLVQSGLWMRVGFLGLLPRCAPLGSGIRELQPLRLDAMLPVGYNGQL